MDYRAAYDMIMDLQEELNLQILEDAMEELKVKPSLRSGLDYKPVKALAATYELQDFLANRIAELVNAGELEPDRLTFTGTYEERDASGCPLSFVP